MNSLYPTLEGLLGSLDFCECDHCRSVLSPAAYLVDLLDFLDPRSEDWEARFPEGPIPLTPFEVLTSRRPDIPRIPLTCENTNTVLPYIDLVNEIMEFDVAGRLTHEAPSDTGGADSVDLMAEPVPLDPVAIRAAYTALADAYYPVGLPFELPLATARRFLGQLGSTFWELLDALAEPSLMTAAGLGMQDVFMEQLGLGPADQEVLFGTDPDPSGWYRLYGVEDRDQVARDPTDGAGTDPNAKDLARSLGVSFRELIRLVEVSFVNPGLAFLEPLRRVGLEVGEALRYVGASGYDPLDASQRADVEASLGEPGVAWLNSAWTGGAFDAAVVLRGLGPGCDFRYVHVLPAFGSSDALVDGFLHRLNLFVRVWRRLGWTIDELDAALAAFFPVGVEVGDAEWSRSALGLDPSELGDRLRSALIHLAHLERTRELLGGGPSKEELISFWSTISLIGRPSLYERLFVATQDDYFNDPLGQYLSESTGTLAAHLPAVQSGTGLTAGEIDAVLQHHGIGTADGTIDRNSIAVDLPLVSMLFRHGVLARSLGISIEDLLSLLSLLGLDPFPASPTEPIMALREDAAYTQTLKFVGLVSAIDQVGGSAEKLDKVFRHRRIDGEAPARRDFLHILRRQLDAVTEELDQLTDPEGLSDDLVRQKLGLIVPSDPAATLTSMWNGSIEYVHTRNGVAVGDRLPEGLGHEPDLQLTYDAVREREVLRVTGVMTPDRRLSILDRHSHSALDGILTGLVDEAAEFLSSHLGREAAALDVELQFRPPPDDMPPSMRQNRDERRRREFSGMLVGLLSRRLRRVRVIETIASTFSVERSSARLLLTETKVLAQPGTDPPVPLIDTLLRAADGGVTAFMFENADLTGAETITHIPDFSWDPPAGLAVSGLRLEALLSVPRSDQYQFRVTELPTSAGVRLGIDGADVASGPEGFETDLVAGRLYRLAVEIRGVDAGSVRVEVESDGLPLGTVSRFELIPADIAGDVETVRRLVSKVVLLADTFSLTDDEIGLLLTDRGPISPVMSLLPVEPVDTPDTRLIAVLRDVLDYLVVRDGWLGGRDRLVKVIAAARSGATPEQLTDLLADAVGRPKPLLGSALAALFAEPTTPPQSAADYVRLWRLLDLQRRTGLDIGDLENAASPGLDIADATELRNAIRSRYETAGWRDVVKPISDDLRQQKRDALVAYLLAHHGLDRIEQLLERYLIDPGMEPVVVTSRIQMAIAAVQLFIQRCFLNLEDQVRPETLDARHWEWMKRYRVWEANRKIFLFPENWLESEFLDQKTHLFKELDANLLAEEVTEDRAEAAFHRYVQGLESIGRLEVISSFQEEGDTPTDKTIHVVGRTWTRPHQWYYRRFSYLYDAWTPWEPVETDVQGDHVAVTVWQDRVHLFWLALYERQEPTDPEDRGGDLDDLAADIRSGLDNQKPRLRYDARLEWSERTSDGWSQPVSSDVISLDQKGSGLIGLNDIDYAEDNRGLAQNAFFISLHGERTLLVSLQTTHPLPGGRWAEGGRTAAGVGFQLDSKHAPPRIVAPRLRHFLTLEGLRPGPPTGYERHGRLAGSRPETQSILEEEREYQIIPCSLYGLPPSVWSEPPISWLGWPFFYQDQDYTFFVEPRLGTAVETPDLDIARSGLEEIDGLLHVAPVGFVAPDDPISEVWSEIAEDIAESIHPTAVGHLERDDDWVTYPATLIEFDGSLIGGIGFVGTREPSDPTAPALLNLDQGTSAVIGDSVFLVDSGGVTRTGAELISNDMSRHRGQESMRDRRR